MAGKEPRAEWHRMRDSATRGFRGFAVISGLGWLLDVCLTMGLVQLGVPPFAASLVGAASAVSFVYAASRLMLLGDGRIGRAQDFGIYAAWQVCAISAASALVALIARAADPFVASLGLPTLLETRGVETLSVAAGFAKALVTPLTLGANFVFMKWLTEHRGRSDLSGQGAR